MLPRRCLLAAALAMFPGIAFAQGEEKAGVEVGYDRGKGARIDAGDDFALRVNLRNQLRFELSRPTSDVGLTDPEISSRFTIVRTRLQLEGHVFGKANRYKFEYGFDRGSYGFVKDGWFEHGFGGLNLRLGQWKRPFNRQEITSDFSLAFPERANTADFVGGGRDVGIAIHNGYEGSPEGLEWVVGVFNRFSGGNDRPNIPIECDQGPPVDCSQDGGATNVPGSLDMGPTLVARLGFNLGGIKGYSEGDLEGGPLRLAVGVSYKIDLADLSDEDDPDTDATESSVGDNLSHGVQADVLLKVAGLDVFAGIYLMKEKTDDAEIGFTGQAGFFVVPKKVQVAGRFSMVPFGEENELEIRGAFNWYWVGHNFKWSTDVGIEQLTDDLAVTTDLDESKPDLQLRTQAQVTF